MRKAIELAKKITLSINDDNTDFLGDYNFFKVFEPILETSEPHLIKNTLIAAIIYGYDNDSKWIDTRVDGITNNKNILHGLSADLKNPTLVSFINLRHEPSLECIGNYLDRLPDWRLRHSAFLKNQYSKTMSQPEPTLSEVDESKKALIFLNWAKAIEAAKRQMTDAEEMIKEIERDYLNTNSKTESDFGVSFTQKSLEMFEQENTKINIESWRDFIKHVYLPSKKVSIG